MAEPQIDCLEKAGTLVKLDINQDGNIHRVMKDTTGDGKIDTILVDESGDGFADIELLDTTGDGKFDTKTKPKRAVEVASQWGDAVFNNAQTAEMVNKLIVAALESFAFTTIVISLVLVQIYLIQKGIEEPTFETSTTIFFLFEVILKMKAMGPYGFFFTKKFRKTGDPAKDCMEINYLNMCDFLVVVLDVTIFIAAYALPQEEEEEGKIAEQYVKTGRSTRAAKFAKLLRLLKITRVVRLLKIVKVFYQVLTRQPNEWVVRRRVHVWEQMNEMNYQIEDKYKFNRSSKRHKRLSNLQLKTDLKKDSWVTQIKEARMHGDKLVRKRIAGQTGLPIIGEEGGKPVPFWASPYELSNIFGVGIGMYFWSLKLFFWMFILITLIHIPSFEYFSTNFQLRNLPSNFDESGIENQTLREVLRGEFTKQTQNAFSKLTSMNFTTMNSEDLKRITTYGKQNFMHGTATCFNIRAVAALPDREAQDDAGMEWIQRNDCELGDNLIFSAATVLVVLVSFYWYYQAEFHRMLTMVLEKRQNTENYSVMINDPNSNMLGQDYHKELANPEVWRDYCERAAGKVAGVSIIMDNGDLLEKLVRRKKLAFDIEKLLTKPTTPKKTKTQKREKKLQALNEKYSFNECQLHFLMQQKFRVAKVFVTFEKEESQRQFLMDYSQGQFASMLDVSIDLPKEKWFQKQKVLDVRPAPDPSSIKYKHLGMASRDRQKIQQLVVLAFVVVFAYVEYEVIKAMTERQENEVEWQEAYAFLPGLLIATMNTIIPSILYALSATFEIHETEAEAISALFNKDSVFRYFNTAFIIYLLTPFHEQLHYERLFRVQAILLFDAFMTPLLHLCDAQRYFQRWIHSRITRSPYDLSIIFSGDSVRLSERYSSLGKIIFVGLFYLPLLPTGSLLAAVGCAITICIDRLGLMYRWKWLPRSNGLELFESLTVHVGLAILVHTYMAMRFFSGWGYDSACPNKAIVRSTFANSSAGYDMPPSLQQYPSVPPQITPPTNSTNYTTLEYAWYKCDKQKPMAQILAIDQDWMSGTQRHLVALYKYCFIAALVIVTLTMLRSFRTTIKRFFLPSYKPRGQVQAIPWSQVPGIRLYVPQFQAAGVGKPYISCDCSDTKFGAAHVGWSISGGSHSDYSLYSEAEPIMQKLGIKQCIFSQCVQYVEDQVDDPNEPDKRKRKRFSITANTQGIIQPENQEIIERKKKSQTKGQKIAKFKARNSQAIATAKASKKRMVV